MATEKHQRVDIGWIFSDQRDSAATAAPADLLCVPLVDIGGGSLNPMFELLADQRQDFEQLAASGALHELTIVESPQRHYEPKPD
jgi:hypothetical protein